MDAEHVVLASGETISVDNPDGYPDGALIVSNGGRAAVLPPDQIRHGWSVSSVRGFFEGMGIGALTGAGVGVTMGLMSGDDDPEEFLAFTAEQKATMAGVMFGLSGAITGALIGLVRGSTDVYTYDTPMAYSTPMVGVAPTDGGAQLAVGMRF
jgi:hypothetical protein